MAYDLVAELKCVFYQLDWVNAQDQNVKSLNQVS